MNTTPANANLTLRHGNPRSFPGINNRLAAAAPLASFSRRWLVVTADLHLITIDFDTGSSTEHLRLTDTSAPFIPYDTPLPAEIPAGAPRPLLNEHLSLSVSPCGTLAAIAQTYGRHAVVIDLATNTPLLPLDRGGYHPDVSRFPLAFFRHDDRTLLIHATDWNRLDITDPRTRELLTPRTFPSAEEKKLHPDAPQGDDYFHASLSISPDSRRICTNGWVWQPVGVPMCWDIEPWLAQNSWEPENGSTRNSSVWFNEYHWDTPLCWLDNHRIITWAESPHLAFSDEDPNMPHPGPCALILDTRPGADRQPLRIIHGPPGGAQEMNLLYREPNGPLRLCYTVRTIGTFQYDGLLHAWTPADGYSVWNIDHDGICLLHSPDFTPLARDSATGDCLTQLPDHTLRLSRVVNA